MESEMSVATSAAARVADDCLHIARQLSPRQNHAETKLESGSVTAVVNACLSAGNLLSGADKLDPLCPPPDGWERKVEFGPDGRMIVTFAQTLSALPGENDAPAPERRPV
jgi:hypothetical protein